MGAATVAAPVRLRSAVASEDGLSDDARPLVEEDTGTESGGMSPHRAAVLRKSSSKLHGGFRFKRSLLADGFTVYLLRSLKAIFLGSKLNILMPFTVLAMIAVHSQWSDGVIFAFALLAICPFAERLGYITEQLCLETKNPTLSGLINATFGNVTELIISIFALVKGKENPLMLRIVQVGLAGGEANRLTPAPIAARNCSPLLPHRNSVLDLGHLVYLLGVRSLLPCPTPLPTTRCPCRSAFWARCCPTCCWFSGQPFSLGAGVTLSRLSIKSEPKRTRAC